MRIGITCYPTYGGSGVVATELGIELAALGHEVHFISYSQPFRLSSIMKAFLIMKFRCRVIRCSSFRPTTWRWPRAWPKWLNSMSLTCSMCAKKNDELRRQAIDSKISAFLHRAADYEKKGDFNRALDEIARAYLLDPANEHIHGLEDRVRRAQEEARTREESERIRRQEEEERKRQEALKAQVARMQQEKEEKRKKEEEARRQAQQQKIKQYLKQAHELYTLGRMDEALSELAFVVVVDPLNEEVLELERKIREAQEQEQQAQVDLYRKREDEQRKKREAIVTAIQKHIENAGRLAEQLRFSEALRVITRAYVLDPINESLQACEKRIVALQEKSLADGNKTARGRGNRPKTPGRRITADGTGRTGTRAARRKCRNRSKTAFR